ncbi:MAG: hypothetical protein J6P62_05525 [Bacteroidales bacterium]|nr:hypothetical protein [Bacteroidales bacterium]
MSELKVRPYTMLPSGQCYDRDEVDKVIAEKDKEIEELRNEADVYKAKYEQEYDIAVHNEKQLSAMRIEIRHQKYKRCLAMFRWCYAESWNCPEHKERFYTRWTDKWRQLAEKFKPNN